MVSNRSICIINGYNAFKNGLICLEVIYGLANFKSVRSIFKAFLTMPSQFKIQFKSSSSIVNVYEHMDIWTMFDQPWTIYITSTSTWMFPGIHVIIFVWGGSKYNWEYLWTYLRIAGYARSYIWSYSWKHRRIIWNMWEYPRTFDNT